VASDRPAYLDPAPLKRRLDAAVGLPYPKARKALADLRGSLERYTAAGPGAIRVTRAVFEGELRQALEAKSEERFRHYLRTLARSLGEESKAPLSDINLRRWKEHEDILTESLWIIPRRDSTGAHSADYHGNFVPQIPNQVIRRYTRPGDLVLDLFAGLGTTLIEARRLGRPSLGVELDPAAAEAAREALDRDAPGAGRSPAVVIVGDSSKGDTAAAVKRQIRAMGHASAKLAVLHPPYHDIITFSGLPGDLSASGSLAEFLRGMDRVFDLAWASLDPGRMAILVIGDKYERSRWVPLAFKTMQRAERRGFVLKSIVVKNMEGNRAKRTSSRLWARRAIAGNFYVFKHEYIFVLEKPRDSPRQVSLGEVRGPPSAGSGRGARRGASGARGSSRRSSRRRT
jgi:DNA methylase